MNGEFVPEGLHINQWLADKVFSLGVVPRELGGGSVGCKTTSPFISSETAIYRNHEDVR